MNVANQVVVITGSSRGFGLAMAQEFARGGAKVVISSRNAESVDAALKTLPNRENVLGMVCDVGVLAEVQRLADATAQKFGRLDIWINNAGLSHPFVKMLDITPEAWHESFETNFFGTANGCRVALTMMLPQHSGHIINILGMGADRPSPNQSAYGSSKAAMLQLTQTLAQEYADTGILINAVQPGMIWTEMLTNAQGVEDNRERMEWAMRVFGNPPEVPARYVVNLVAPARTSGKFYRVLSPRVYVPRMVGEMLGAGKRNPRPWEK